MTTWHLCLSDSHFTLNAKMMVRRRRDTFITEAKDQCVFSRVGSDTDIAGDLSYVI